MDDQPEATSPLAAGDPPGTQPRLPPSNSSDDGMTNCPRPIRTEGGHTGKTPPPATDRVPRTQPGRVAAKLDPGQCEAFLEAIASGKGVDLAVREMKVSYRAYLNTIRADPDFRGEVASARRCADQALDEFAYLRATAGDAVDLLLKLLERRDRARFLNLARSDRARERAEDLAERRLDRALNLHLAEMEAAARAEQRERAAPPAADCPAPDFSRLSEAELALFRALLAKACGQPAALPSP
jgi:hypothetical protein